MRGKILTKNGVVDIDNIHDPEIYSNFNALKSAVTNYFDDWLNCQNYETKSMYADSFEELDGESYLSMSGAIEEGINAVTDYMSQNNIAFLTTKEFYKIDLEGVFQA